MLKICLNIKPLSSNVAWQGRRFSTKAKTQFENAMHLLLPTTKVCGLPYYRMAYDFFLVNFSRTDIDNLVKTSQDCLVRRGIISDDRLIVDARIRKFPAKTDRIEIEIEGIAL